MPGYRGRGFPATVDVVAVGGLSLAGSTVTASAAELNLLDADNLEPADAVWAATTRWAKATWDFAVDGGAVSTIDLGINIPDNAIVLSGACEVVTTCTGGGGGGGCQISLGLGAGPAALLAATAVASFTTVGPSMIPCAAIAAAPTKMPSAGAVTLTITNDTATAGKLNVWVEYLMGEA